MINRESMSWTLVAGILVLTTLSVPRTRAHEPQAVKDGQPKVKRTLGEDVGSVSCQLQDKAGNIWFSTAGSGVFRFDGRSFTNFTTADGLSDNSVGSIIQDKAGNIVFGTARGICKFDGMTFINRAELGEFKTTCLLEDRDGNLWFGTMAKGVFRYDGKNLTNFLNSEQFNLRDRYQLILDIHQDRSGNIWFSSWNGGGVWRYDGKTFKNFLPAADYYLVKDGFSEDGRAGAQAPPDAPYQSRTKTIGDDMIFSIAEDSAGNLWFATRRHGACRYDPAREEFTHFRGKEGFGSASVYSILEDRKGNIWLTTEATGVWRYDGKEGGFKNFTTKDGLADNSVFTVLEDKDGNLWFGTRRFGLSRYDGASFTTFSE